jgi:hypothetical protein
LTSQAEGTKAHALADDLRIALEERSRQEAAVAAAMKKLRDRALSTYLPILFLPDGPRKKVMSEMSDRRAREVIVHQVSALVSTKQRSKRITRVVSAPFSGIPFSPRVAFRVIFGEVAMASLNEACQYWPGKRPLRLISSAGVFWCSWNEVVFSDH